MTIYCPLCNSSSEDVRFIGNFCEPCIVKKLEKKVPAKVTVYQCRWCERIKEGRTFSRMNNKSLSRAVKIELRLQDDVRVKKHDKDSISAVIVTQVDGERVAFPVKFELKIAHETCQRCYWISSGYYEAIVQLRGNREKIDRLVEKIKKYVERRGGFVVKTEEMENNGLDIYTSDKLAMNEFFHDYKLKPARSFRLYGMKNGRKVYRNTYSLHL